MLTERDVLRALQAMVRGHVERVRPMPATAAEGAACDFGFAEPGGGEVWDNAGQGN